MLLFKQMAELKLLWDIVYSQWLNPTHKFENLFYTHRYSHFPDPKIYHEFLVLLLEKAFLLEVLDSKEKIFL